MNPNMRDILTTKGDPTEVKRGKRAHQWSEAHFAAVALGRPSKMKRPNRFAPAIAEASLSRRTLSGAVIRPVGPKNKPTPY